MYLLGKYQLTDAALELIYGAPVHFEAVLPPHLPIFWMRTSDHGASVDWLLQEGRRDCRIVCAVRIGQGLAEGTLEYARSLDQAASVMAVMLEVNLEDLAGQLSLALRRVDVDDFEPRLLDPLLRATSSLRAHRR